MEKKGGDYLRTPVSKAWWREKGEKCVGGGHFRVKKVGEVAEVGCGSSIRGRKKKKKGRKPTRGRRAPKIWKNKQPSQRGQTGLGRRKDECG